MLERRKIWRKVYCLFPLFFEMSFILEMKYPSNLWCFKLLLFHKVIAALKNKKTFDFSFCKSCANFVATIMEMMLFSLRARRCKYFDTKDFSTRKPNKISKGKNKNFARNSNSLNHHKFERYFISKTINISKKSGKRQ